MGADFGKVLHARSKNFAARIKMAIFATPKDIHEARTESRPSFSREPAAKSWFQAQAVESLS